MIVTMNSIFLAVSVLQSAVVSQPPIVWSIGAKETCSLSRDNWKSVLNAKEEDGISKLGDKYFFRKRNGCIFIISKLCSEFEFMELKLRLLEEVLKIRDTSGSFKLSRLSDKSFRTLGLVVAQEMNLTSDRVLLDRQADIVSEAKRFVTFRTPDYGDFKIIASPVVDAMTAEMKEEFARERLERQMSRLKNLASQKSNVESLSMKDELKPAVEGTVQVVDELKSLTTPSETTGFNTVISGVSPRFSFDKRLSELQQEAYEQAKAIYKLELRKRTNQMYAQFQSADRFAFLSKAEASPTETEIKRYTRSLRFNLEQNSTDSKMIDSILKRAVVSSRSDGLLFTIRMRLPDGQVRAFWPTIDF